MRHFGQADNLSLSLEFPNRRPASNRLVIDVVSAPDISQSDSPPYTPRYLPTAFPSLEKSVSRKSDPNSACVVEVDCLLSTIGDMNLWQSRQVDSDALSQGFRRMRWCRLFLPVFPPQILCGLNIHFQFDSESRISDRRLLIVNVRKSSCFRPRGSCRPGSGSTHPRDAWLHRFLSLIRTNLTDRIW